MASQLCRYKAYFRWDHYTNDVAPGIELPEGTEACPSVTSAFLQILATIHNVEAARIDKPRNILRILSSNTRRTKVVELAGAHRMTDDPRKHCLPDGEGGYFTTNLDRNRYGSDNNYLFTVTRFDLEALGLCPGLVDIEIIDTRNGNEAQLVTAGAECTCEDPTRKELNDISYYAATSGGQAGPAASPQARAAPASPEREMRRVASAGHLGGSYGGGGMRRVSSSLRRPPSVGKLHYGGGEASRGSGGSDLFDALLMAATDNLDRDNTQGEPPVTSNAARDRARNKIGAGTEADSLLGDPKGSAKGRPMLRRNSVSMIIENPVLAQTGAAESLLMNYWNPFMHAMGADQQHSGQPSGEGEGDTEARNGEDDHGESLRQGLLRHFHKQSSAVNLNRLTHVKSYDNHIEELKAREREALAKVEAAQEELKATQMAARCAAETIKTLKDQLGMEDAADVEVPGLLTSEQHIALLQKELEDKKSELAKEKLEKKGLEEKLQMAVGGIPMPGNLPPIPYAAMLPMFGLNPFGGMSPATAAATAHKPPRAGGGVMQKVASMPTMHHGAMSPPPFVDRKRHLQEESEEDVKEDVKRQHMSEENAQQSGKPQSGNTEGVIDCLMQTAAGQVVA